MISYHIHLESRSNRIIIGFEKYVNMSKCSACDFAMMPSMLVSASQSTRLMVVERPQLQQMSNGKVPQITQMLHGAGICSYIWAMFGVNAGNYSIHGASQISKFHWQMIYIYIYKGDIFQSCMFTRA